MIVRVTRVAEALPKGGTVTVAKSVVNGAAAVEPGEVEVKHGTVMVLDGDQAKNDEEDDRRVVKVPG